MFKRVRNKNRRGKQVNSRGNFAGSFIGFEVLEDRRLMSAGQGPPPGGPGGAGPGGSQGQNGAGQQVTQIAFSLIPAAAQTELDSLATTAGLSDPTSTTAVALGNVNGVETYSVTIDGTGTVTQLTSDAGGNSVTAPTTSTTTWATLDGTGTGSDSAAASEIAAIATALNLTAPSDDTVVNVVTTSDGTTTYSLKLAPGSDSSDGSNTAPDVSIAVLANGDPTGNETLPFNVLPTAIQTAFNDNLPTGATALSSDSTQSVQIQIVDGVTLYSTTFTSTGTTTTVTLDAAGSLTSLPTHTTGTFADLTSAQQTELQALATAEGDTTTLTSDQSVDVLSEANGVTLFSITIPVTATDSSGNSLTNNETITIDSSGDPTVLPGPGIGGPAGGGGMGTGQGGQTGGQGQCPPASGQGTGESGGSDDGSGNVNPGGPMQGETSAGSGESSNILPTGTPTDTSSGSSGANTGSDDSGTCPTPTSGGSTSTGSSDSSSSSSDTTTVSSGAIAAPSTSDTTDTTSSKKSSKKSARTVVVKVASTKKAKKTAVKKKT